MPAPEGPPVVVGIDGSEAAELALVWAADEAQILGVELLIVHAGDIVLRGGLSAPTVTTMTLEMAAYGHELVTEALATVAMRCPSLQATTLIRSERPSKVLLELSRSATLLVVGSRGEGWITGTLLGSVSQKVAAHAHCPTVILSPHSVEQFARTAARTAAHAARSGAHVASTAEPGSVPTTIVVGVSPSPSGADALAFAFAQAVARGGTVLAIRSWGEMYWGGSGFGYPPATYEDWGPIAASILEQCLVPLRARYPAVPVRTEVTSEDIYTALSTRAEGAAMLVLGCRYSNDHLFSRLGPVSTWLLHHAPCPVAIVGQPTLKPALARAI